MRITFDREADAAYVYLQNDIAKGAAVENVVVERVGKGDLVLDFDADGYLLGIEIIGAMGLLHKSLLAAAERF
jgi:uncharacterized protein YuzE